MKIKSYQIIRQAWQNPASMCDTVEIIYEDGSVTEESHHPTSHWWLQDRFKEVTLKPFRMSKFIGL